jgi:hypothetical protein
MSWWVLELITDAVLLAILVVLGPLIKRFGRAYAGDIFRANPRTGKSYLVLMDIAYYLVFTSFILFTITIERPSEWSATAGGRQLEVSLVRVGGMMVLMGVLHGLNVVTLPVIGRLLGLSRAVATDPPD